MGWKSKFTRRRTEKYSEYDRSDSAHKRCHGDDPAHLKSCLKEKSTVVVDDGQCSLSSSSASFRSGESGLIDRRSSVHESLRTRSTDFSSSTRSSSRSRARKNVRFHEIQIREYGRTVGDNPSVSTGPPVGIDWKFEETIKMDVNCYESYRGPRREQLEMVLTRNERENLLMEWGVPTHLIADGTRSALKVKNQRKQTVVNAGKVAKLEEAIESASRRFKEAFSLKSMSNRVREDESDVRKKTYTTISREMHASQAVNNVTQGNSIARTVSADPETDIFERIGIPCVSKVVGDTSRGPILTRCSLDQYQKVNHDVPNDDVYTLGATTFGNNSVSPSVLEMEKFYQELELEMFGEEASLPCMIGQTLEVSSYEKDIDDCVDDMTIASSSVPFGGDQMATAAATSPHQGPHPTEYQMQGSVVAGNYRSEPSQYHVSQFSHLSSAPVMQYTPPESAWTQHNAHQQGMVRSRERISSYGAVSNYEVERSHGSSQCDFFSAQRQLPHFQISTSNYMMCWNEHVRNNSFSYQPPFDYPDNRCDEEGCIDSPRVCHSSLQHGHLSPHQWMEECDGPQSYINGSVTIMEDDIA